MATAKKCAHPACNCTPKDGEEYCSTYCHDARGDDRTLVQLRASRVRGRDDPQRIRSERSGSSAESLLSYPDTSLRGGHSWSHRRTGVREV